MAVEIPDVKDFDDIEALDKAFKKAIAKADDADETELRIAHANARADFYEIRNKRAALDVAKRDALDRYPLAKEFADDITGRTVEEIEAKAKRMHEKLEQMVGQRTAAQQADQAQELATIEGARAAYGQPAAAGGGAATPTSPQLTAREEAIARVHARLQNGEGLQGGRGKQDVNIMSTERLRQAIDFQTQPHPELGLGVGGSYKGEGPNDRRVTDARVAQRTEMDKQRRR